MEYRVYDKETKKDITNEYPWVITPDGKLYYQDMDSLTGYPNAVIANGYDYMLDTLKFNLLVTDNILTNTIKNENGEETNTMKFNDVKSFATYLKAMNDISINYIKEKTERSII